MFRDLPSLLMASFLTYMVMSGHASLRELLIERSDHGLGHYG